VRRPWPSSWTKKKQHKVCRQSTHRVVGVRRVPLTGMRICKKFYSRSLPSKYGRTLFLWKEGHAWFLQSHCSHKRRAYFTIGPIVCQPWWKGGKWGQQEEREQWWIFSLPVSFQSSPKKRELTTANASYRLIIRRKIKTKGNLLRALT
jgi:hypothetical protein